MEIKVFKTLSFLVAEEFLNSLNSIESIRAEILNLQENSESSRDLLYKYASYIFYLRIHFPIDRYFI
jgi:hypothetical protein